jgi:hypothetical protein
MFRFYPSIMQPLNTATVYGWIYLLFVLLLTSYLKDLKNRHDQVRVYTIDV